MKNLCSKVIKNPTMQQVIYIDLETTNLIDHHLERYPWIIEFSAYT